MLDFALQQSDFVRRQSEELEDPLVDLGFGIGELPAEFVHFGPLFLDVRLPFVGGARGGERILLPLKARLQGEPERDELLARPLLSLIVEFAVRVLLGAEAGQKSIDWNPITYMEHSITKFFAHIQPRTTGEEQEVIR